MFQSSRFTLHQLIVFKHVCEQGSLSATAAILDTAQPSISRLIKSLEEVLGVPLLHRTGRGVTPTQTGKRLFFHANSILAAVAEAENDVLENAKNILGTVRFGVTPMVSQIITGPLASRIKKDQPSITLQVHEGSSKVVTEWVANGDVDVAVMYKPPSQFKESADSTILREEPLCLVEKADNQPKPSAILFTDAIRQPLVLPSRVNGMRRLLDKMAHENRIKLNIVQEIDSHAAILSMIRHGGAATILPHLAISDELRARLLRATPIENPIMTAQLSLYISHAVPLRRASRVVVDFIQDLISHPNAR